MVGGGGGGGVEEEEYYLYWSKVTLPLVFQIVSPWLQQRDVISLLLVSPWCYRALSSHHSLWQVYMYALIFYLFLFLLGYDELVIT